VLSEISQAQKTNITLYINLHINSKTVKLKEAGSKMVVSRGWELEDKGEGEDDC
jgi:hypothetical protein